MYTYTYLKNTKSASDVIFKWIDMMILREHFFSKNTNATRLKAACTAHYNYIV